MSRDEVLVTLAVLGGIVLFTVVVTVLAVRHRNALDADARALRAAQVLAQCKDLLHGPDFLWAVWQDTAKAAAMQVLIRNARDEIVTTVSVPGVATDGVLRRFELDGKRYEVRKAGLWSNRTCLYETGRDAVLFSAEHRTRTTLFSEGDGGRELFSLPQVLAWRRFRPCKRGEELIGKLILGLDQTAYGSVLTLPPERVPLLAQLFVLVSR